MNNLDFNSFFDGVEGVKRPINQERVSVVLKQAVSPTHVRIYASAFNNAFCLHNSSLSIDQTVLLKYLTTIAKWRVDSVNGKRLPPEAKQVLIPAVYSIAILHLGLVFDPEQGIHLVPVFNVDDNDLLSASEMLDFSYTFLTLLEDMGATFVRGLPRDLSGSLDVMYFHFIESQVLRHDNKSHPGMAALASFFEFHQLENVLNHRVSYGYIAEQELILRQIIMKGK